MTAAEWGKQLAAARRARGWTQESLAEQLGVSRQAVTKWERGAALPGPGNLLALRQCLGDALPAPPAPAEETTGGAGKPTVQVATEKRVKIRPWLLALAVLCVVFCLLSLVTYVFTALAGFYLLLVTVAAVAVVCKVRGQSAAPALWGGLKAVGVQVTALAATAVRQYPALAEAVDGAAMPDSQQTQAQWDTDLQQLWQKSAR